MEALAIVTALALIQLTHFAYLVGAQRAKHGIKAPAMTGHTDFERAFRVHQNTQEQLVVLVPALWMFGYFIDPLWSAGIGLVFIVSRFLYRTNYLSEPTSRGTPFLVGFVMMSILVIGSIVGATMSLLG